MTQLAPVVYVVVYKMHPLLTVGRPQQYRWRAVNNNNGRKLAVSGESYTNRADALHAACELFADESVELRLLDQAGYPDWFPLPTVPKPAGMFQPSNVYLIQDGVSGMQPLRVKDPAA